MALGLRLCVLLATVAMPLLAHAQSDPASVLIERGAALAQEGRFAEALQVTQDACRLQEERVGGDHALVHRCRTEIAKRLVRVGRPQEAEATARAAASRLGELAGSTDPATLEAQQVIAIALFQQGRFRESEGQALAVHEVRRVTLGEEHADTMASLNTAAAATLESGQYTQARDLFKKIIAVNERTRGSDNAATLVAMNNLASTQFYLGDFEQAQALYSEVHARRTRSLGRRHPATLAVLTSLTNVKLSRGRSAEALDLALPASEELRQVLGERHPETLRQGDLMSRIYVDLGRYDQAVRISESVVDRSNAVLGMRHPDSVRYTKNLGRARFFLRDYASAIDAYASAASVAPDVFGPQHAETLQAFQGMGYCYLRLDQAAKALQAFRRALDAAGNLAENHPHRLSLDSGIQQARFKLGERGPALGAMEENLARVRAFYGGGNESLLNYNASFAYYLLEDGQRSRAETLLEESVRIASATEKSAFLGTEFRQSRFAMLADGAAAGAGLKALVELRIARGDNAGAFALSETLKARTLSELMDLRAVASLPGNSRRDLDDFRETLLRIDELNLSGAAAAPGSDDGIANAARRQELERMAQAKASALALVPATNAADVRMERNTAFVSFIANGDRVSALVVKGHGEIRGFVLGAIPGLADSVEAYRRWIASATPSVERVWRMPHGAFRWSMVRPEGGVRVKNADEIGAALSRHLIAPLAVHLADVRHWVISPDGPLSLIPFETLLLGDKRVLMKHEVSYTQSLGVLARLRARAAAPGADGVLIVAATEGPISPPPGAGTDVVPGWQRLDAAVEEAAGVARAHRGERTVRLEGRGASESAIRDLARSGDLRRFRVLHFAAHGYLSPSHPQLSSVVLAGDGRSADSDGYLSAAEWPSLSLASELVVISSCESGAGRIVSGEGVLGLPYALTLAGNRRTVLALWEVDDRASAQFMPDFHRRLRSGMSAARALAETKRQFAQPGSRWRDPRHWASFVLYGG